MNKKKSFYWILRAADAGNLTAIFNAGIMYEKGIGVEASYQNAAKYYQKAVDLGDEEAKTKLLQLASR